MREKGAGCPLCVCTKGAAGVGERSRSVCGVSEASWGASVCVSGRKRERKEAGVSFGRGSWGVCVRGASVCEGSRCVRVYVCEGREAGMCMREGKPVCEGNQCVYV